MRIISNFQDYYDAGISYGVDKNIYFKREIKHIGKDYTSYHKINGLVFNVTYIGEVGFCGKIYPYIVKREVNKEMFPNGIEVNKMNDENTKDTFYYSTKEFLEDYPKYLEKKDYQVVDNKKEKLLNDYFDNKAENPFKNYNHIKNYNFKQENYFQIYDCSYYIKREFSDNLGYLFSEKDPRYFTQFDIHGILKKVQFSKVFNPYQAFQEISMYLGAKQSLAELKECEISDKDRMKGHGMDCTSFRNVGPKTKKCK